MSALRCERCGTSREIYDQLTADWSRVDWIRLAEVGGELTFLFALGEDHPGGART